MELLPFIGVATLLIVTPGADMALLARNAFVGGRGAALRTAVGIEVGVVVWTLAAALGVAAVLTTSATAYTVLKLAGGAYLVYLGLQALSRSRRRPPVPAPRRGGREPGSPFLQGLASNLLNPKLAVFFTTLLPQFVEPGGSSTLDLLALGAVFSGLALVWLLGFAWFAAGAGSLLRRDAVRRSFERVSGVVLVALGVRLATEAR